MPISRRMTKDETSQNLSKERFVRHGFWRKFKAVAGRIGFAREAVAAWYCAMDPATPMRAKAVLLGALAYFITPIDVLPDFLLVLGFTDDAAVFWAAWRAVRDHVTDDHRARAERALKD
jgi:uncharacterized membrane protein YkvA (DUF1232 family)